ncbi:MULTISPECIES: DUF3515 domain-containing protein [Streptomyces]|uniref:DUF3515 domain-containing protein n=1 Tax=Streptomyces TaxID=1883 RepID=UPI0031D9B9A7
MKSALHRPSGLPVLALLLAAAACAVTACSGPGGQAGPAVPTPPAAEAALCRALHAQLPATVDGLKRRATDPASDLTAAWGDGVRITLRCGVPKPELLKRRPDADSVDVDDVGWLPERQSDGSVRCTTVRRSAWVEVTLPRKVVGDAGDISALTDLSGAVRRTIPEGIIS